MIIKLKMNVPVDDKHNMKKDRELEVLRYEPKKNGDRFHQAGYWVQGDGEEVKILSHECTVVEK